MILHTNLCCKSSDRHRHFSESKDVERGLCRHRVVVGKIYPDAVQMNEDDFLEKVMGFLLVRHITFFTHWCRVYFFIVAMQTRQL